MAKKEHDAPAPVQETHAAAPPPPPAPISAGEARIITMMIAQDGKITKIPTAPADLGPVLAAVAATAKQLDAALAAIAKIGSGGPPPPPDPTPTDWPCAAGSTSVILTAATKTGAYHSEAAMTVQGAGMRRTVLDGRGGVDHGNRLAWGKGILHTTADLIVRDVGFIHAGTMGDGLGKSDGEAGVYAEGIAAIKVLLQRCAFDHNENGIFQPTGSAVDMTIDRCVFGRVGANGLDDGSSHDFYLGGHTITVKDCVFLGSSRGNTMKCRGPNLTVSGSWVGRSNGRWIDLPGGTVATSTGNIFVTLPDASSQNALGFFDEDDINAAPGSPGSYISSDDRFYFSRHDEVIWINHADFHVEFIRPQVFWIGAPGSTPPNVTIKGPGAIAGVNPFHFDATNRVDAAPPAPADAAP